MIYVEVQGNLGNQLFQYAYARHIQEKTGQTICLNLYNFNKGRPDLKFSLDDYVLNDNVIIDREHKLPFFADSYSLTSRIVKKCCAEQYVNLLKNKGIVMWQRRPYIGELPANLKNYYISGWFQNPLYFDDVKEILKKELSPHEPPVEANSELMKVIQERNSICISIRRGDYVTNEKFKKKYYICTQEYFSKAIDLVKKSNPDATLVFFSDDIEWVKENVYHSGEAFYESGNDPVWEKLRLMSACKHFILSNSSFSWWAQYLGSDDDSIVVAPSRWKANEQGKTPIYQDNWKLIEV